MQRQPKMGLRRPNVIKAILLGGVILISGLVIARSQPTFTLTDQVIINTQRLNDLERRMRQMEEGGSSVAIQTAGRVSINDAIDARQEAEINELKTSFLGVMIFLVTGLVGFVMFILKDRLFGGTPPRSHRRD